MLSVRLAWVQSQAADALVRIAARKESPEVRQEFLPHIKTQQRAMPNHLARSSLFAQGASGPWKYEDGIVLVTRRDATIIRTGYQLHECHADAWMQLMHEAANVPLGQPVKMLRASFLRAIGRGTCGDDYDWLREAMVAFTETSIIIEVRRRDGSLKYRVGNTEPLPMVAAYVEDADDKTCVFVIDPRWKRVFDRRECALIDWEKRSRLKPRQDMAKALQRLVATSSDPVQRYSLDWLKEKLQYSSPMRKFRKALLAAMRELERVGVMAGGRIELSTKGREQAAWSKLDD